MNSKKTFLANQSVTECTSQWRCFAKGISVTHVILTFVPATLEDLKNLMKYESDNTNITTSNENIDRASSQASNYSEVPINNTNSLSLPIYVFDCPLQLLVESYINNLEESAIMTTDVYEDHRYKFDEILPEESIKFVL